jgi:membrane protein implicated in regulation of membrane protease activity
MRLGWVAAALIVGLGVVGVVTGSATFWIIALLFLAVAVLVAIGVPRNVRDLEVPPGMPNARGDLDLHDPDLDR